MFGIVRKIRHALANRRGASGFLAVLAAVPAVVLTILVIVMVLGSLDTTMGNMDLGAEGNDTRTEIFTNVWNGMSMTPIVIIILFASVVLGAIGLLGLRG